MKEIERQILIQLLNSNSSQFVDENVVHVLFKRYGRERDIDVDKIELLSEETKDEEK